MNHNYYVSASKVLVHNKNPKNITKLADDVMEWLGEGATRKLNKAGDPYFMSRDGNKMIRFDWNNPHGDAIHMHFRVKNQNGKWVDAVKGKHRIYFNGK